MTRSSLGMREEADAPEWGKAAFYLGLLVAIGVILFVLRPGCDATASAQETVVDLDKVLLALEAASQGEPPEDVATRSAETEDPQVTQAFLDRFRQELNAAGINPQPVGVHLTQQGTLQGYHDKDSNNIRTADEPELFEVAYDEQNNRAIASETVAGETYRRSHSYHHSSGGGFWSGYLIGRMLDRRNSYYSSASRTPPNYSGFAMSSDNYLNTARSRASAAARSSSARGGRSGWGGGGFGGGGK